MSEKNIDHRWLDYIVAPLDSEKVGPHGRPFRQRKKSDMVKDASEKYMVDLPPLDSGKKSDYMFDLPWIVKKSETTYMVGPSLGQ